jgi:hypothetical protein
MIFESYKHFRDECNARSCPTCDLFSEGKYYQECAFIAGLQLGLSGNYVAEIEETVTAEDL